MVQETPNPGGCNERVRGEKNAIRSARLRVGPLTQGELRCYGKRPVSDAIAATGACRKRGGIAAGFQQLRRSCYEAAGPDGNSNRNVEVREATRPLRYMDLVGEGIRDAVLFLCITS